MSAGFGPNAALQAMIEPGEAGNKVSEMIDKRSVVCGCFIAIVVSVVRWSGHNGHRQRRNENTACDEIQRCFLTLNYRPSVLFRLR